MTNDDKNRDKLLKILEIISEYDICMVVYDFFKIKKITENFISVEFENFIEGGIYEIDIPTNILEIEEPMLLEFEVKSALHHGIIEIRKKFI